MQRASACVLCWMRALLTAGSRCSRASPVKDPTARLMQNWMQSSNTCVHAENTSTTIPNMAIRQMMRLASVAYPYPAHKSSFSDCTHTTTHSSSWMKDGIVLVLFSFTRSFRNSYGRIRTRKRVLFIYLLCANSKNTHCVVKYNVDIVDNSYKKSHFYSISVRTTQFE